MDNNAQDVIYTGQLGCNDGYYLCPNCHYQLIYKEDLTSTVDFYYKQFCEFCGTKLNWTNRDRIGSQLNKVDFLADIFKIKKECLNLLTQLQSL
jgi:transcription initiation factor IIE alpha subunit